MRKGVIVRFPCGATGLAGGLLWVLAMPACATNTVASGVAVGRVGHGLSAKAQTVPQGAEVCALGEALAATPPGATEKPLSETCSKAAKSDELWRRSMVVLAAHADKLDALASGAKPETAGQLEAATTGVRGADWIQVDDAQEQAARDAVAQLVSQMGTSAPKADLAKVVQDAAPHVKTLCEGLTAYLDKEVKAAADIENDVEKKRAARANHRCGMLDNRTICVSESFVDRIVYAEVYGRAAAVASSHMEARDAVATFCAAHQKLEEVSANGQLAKDQAYLDVVEAVKAAPRSQSPQAAGAKPDDSKSAAPGKGGAKPEEKSSGKAAPDKK
jgi:hypothetical protein